VSWQVSGKGGIRGEKRVWRETGKRYYSLRTEKENFSEELLLWFCFVAIFFHSEYNIIQNITLSRGDKKVLYSLMISEIKCA